MRNHKTARNIKVLETLVLYIYIYMCIYSYTYRRTDVYLCIHTRLHTYTHTHVHMYGYMYKSTYVYKYIHTYTQRNIYAHTYIYTYQIYVCIYIYIYSYITMRTNTLQFAFQLWCFASFRHIHPVFMVLRASRAAGIHFPRKIPTQIPTLPLKLIGSCAKHFDPLNPQTC